MEELDAELASNSKRTPLNDTLSIIKKVISVSTNPKPVDPTYNDKSLRLPKVVYDPNFVRDPSAKPSISEAWEQKYGKNGHWGLIQTKGQDHTGDQN